MGIDSDYYKEKNKKQLTKLRMLEAKLPPYVTFLILMIRSCHHRLIR